jgi:hypothetical protein
MDRCVNYGTHLVLKCDRAGQEKQVLAAVMLGLHAVEVLDAIAILIRKCCVDPAKNLLRSQMEAMFAIQYMAQSDSERKAIQYVVAHAHGRIDLYQKMDPTTERGKQLIAQLKKDSTFHELNIVQLDTRANIENLQNMLARAEYAEAETNWQQMRQQKNGRIPWYSLYSGPKNIEELAVAVGDSAWYQILYRMYSGEIHATNALGSLHATREVTRGEYQPLRYPTDLPVVSQITISMALRTYRALIEMLLPNEKEEYAKWFVKEIKPVYGELSQFKIVDPGRPSRVPPKR